MNELDLFVAAIAITDSAERVAFLDRECANNSAMRQRLDALLVGNELSRHPLDLLPGAANSAQTVTSAGNNLDPTADHPGTNEQAGAVIAGKYTLVELIGEGGMGSVWRAKQTEPVKRFVAVKLIKAGMDSKQVLARFEAERQALALMDHPNIAKVLDGGLHENRPFFAMELVKGIPITEYCDKCRLTPRERLELFVPICHAIQHAHQKGIIHRDIKPNNVLIALYDDKPVVKVIDFGVAKATGGALTEATIDTGFGGVVGTPQYMSPEQATFNNLDIDTRSDVYALGVLLYELLTGSPPFSKKELEKRGLLEMLRVVREEEPPRPSTKLSTADALPTLSANRATEPKKLTGLLRNELDWIVMKALEKDRTRRYETANGFAADVLRYLSGEAVQAHPPSRAYRIKKFVRRNKGQVIAASLVLVALVAGVVGTSLGLFEAKRQAAEARRQEGIARDEATMKEIARAEEAAQHARAEKAYARTADVLDIMVSGVTGDSLATQKTITPEQKKFLTDVLTYYQEFAGEKADDEKSLFRTARAAFYVGVIESRLGRKQEAVVATQKARAGFAKLAAQYPGNYQYHENLASCHTDLGVLLVDLGKQADAEVQHREAMAILEQLAGEYPDKLACRELLAESHGNLGLLMGSTGRHQEAEQQLRKGMVIWRDRVTEVPANPANRHELAQFNSNLGLALDSNGKRAEAEQQHRQALALREKLATEFPDNSEYNLELAKVHINLAINLGAAGQRPEAEKHYREALTIQTRLVAEFPAVPAYKQVLARAHINLAILLKGHAQLPEAEEHYRKGLIILAKLAADFPAEPVYSKEMGESCISLGAFLFAQGQLPAADEQFHKALVVLEKLVDDFPAEPAYRQVLANNYTIVGFHLHGLGKLQEAEEYYRKAMAIQEKFAAEFPNDQENSVGLGGSYCNIANTTRDRGKPSESLKWFDKAIGLLTPTRERELLIPNARQYLRTSHANRAIALDRLKQSEKAIPDWVKALELTPKEQKTGIRLARLRSWQEAGLVAEAVAEAADLTKSPFWNADQWYDFACIYAVASGKIADKKEEYAKRAVELLRQSVKAGWKDVVHMKKDTDLDSLHDREEFKTLLAELEADSLPKR